MSNEVEIVVTDKYKSGGGFKSAEKDASKLGGTLGKVGDIAGKTGVGIGKMGGIVGAGLALVGGAVIGAGIKVTDMAGKLELMGKKSAIVFGSQLTSVQNWADKSAHSMGLTKREAVGLAAGFADLLIPMGFTRKAAAEMAQQTIGLSGALAEWTGGQKSAAEVSEILSAAYLGERDGLQALGISISQAEVDAALLAKGQQNLTGAQRQQAEATATQALIFAKSKDAQAAFANGADSLARRTTESKARMREMGDTLLVMVTPALIKIGDAIQKHVLPKLEKFVNWFAGPGKFVIAEWSLDALASILSFGDQFLHVLSVLLDGTVKWGVKVLAAVGAVARGMGPMGATTAAAAELASRKLADWAGSAKKSVDESRAKIRDWNTSVATMRNVVQLKANKADLDTKLAAAKRSLADPNLTRERRAQINANIAKLQAAVNAAQAKINSLQGKTVTITTRRVTITSSRSSSAGVGGGHAVEYTGGSIKGFAGGGFASNRFLVGERGPEFMDLSGGVARITPAGNTARQLAGSGGPQTVVLEVHSGGSRMDDFIAELIRRYVKINGGNVQAVFGQ